MEDNCSLSKNVNMIKWYLIKQYEKWKVHIFKVIEVYLRLYAISKLRRLSNKVPNRYRSITTYNQINTMYNVI